MSGHSRPGRLALQLAGFGTFILVGLAIRWAELGDTGRTRALVWAAVGFGIGCLVTGVLVLRLAARRRVRPDRDEPERRIPLVSTWAAVAIGLLAAALIRGHAIDAVGGFCVGFCLLFALSFRSSSIGTNHQDELTR